MPRRSPIGSRWTDPNAMVFEARRPGSAEWVRCTYVGPYGGGMACMHGAEPGTTPPRCACHPIESQA